MEELEAPELSVVVLCYQTGESIRSFLARVEEVLRGDRIPFELVLVANFWPGTEDSTPEVVAALARENPRVRAVARPKEGGMGWDMRSGFAAARGRFVAIIDGDGQMPPEDLARVFRAMRREGWDVAKTVRLDRRDGAFRRVQSTAYNLLLRALFPGIAGRDANAKPKILSRDVLARMALVSDDWFIDTEIMIRARRMGLAVGEVPSIFLKNVSRGSFVRASAVLEFLRNLAWARVREFLVGWRLDGEGNTTP